MEAAGITTDRGDNYRDIQAAKPKAGVAQARTQGLRWSRRRHPPCLTQNRTSQKIAADAIRKEQERQEQARKDQDKLQEELIAEDKNLKELGQIYREAERTETDSFSRPRNSRSHHRWEQQQEQRQRERAKTKPLRRIRQTKRCAVENRRQDLIADRDRRYLEGDIRNAGDRYSQALHHNYDWGDPYLSLAKVAIAEHASFRKEQEVLSAEIAKTADPKAREALEIRRQDRRLRISDDHRRAHRRAERTDHRPHQQPGGRQDARRRSRSKLSRTKTAKKSPFRDIPKRPKTSVSATASCKPSAAAPAKARNSNPPRHNQNPPEDHAHETAKTASPK